MNLAGKNYQQTDINYIYQTLQINTEYIHSRNTELYQNNFGKYIKQHSQEFSHITI